MRKRDLLTWIMRPWVIIIFTLFMIGAVVVVGNQSFKATERATFAEFNQRQLVMAQEAASGIEMYFDFVAGLMKGVSQKIGNAHFDEVASRKAISCEMIEREYLGINDIGVLDDNGVVKYTANAPQIEGKDFSWRKYFQKTKDADPSHNNYFIEFVEFKGVNAGQKGVILAVPIFEPHTIQDGLSVQANFIGVAVCTIELDTLTQKFVASIKSSKKGYAFLITKEYDALWTPDRTLFGKNLLETTEKFPSFQQVLKKMSTGEVGTDEYFYYLFDDDSRKFTAGRNDNLIAYVPLSIGQDQWSIGIWAPKSDARRLIHSVYIKHILLVCVIVITTLLGSSYTLAMVFRYNQTLEKEVDRKTIEFKESHQRLLTVFDSLDAGVYVADMETYEILFANRYLRDAFGNVTGKVCWQVFQQGLSGPCKFCTNKKLLTPDGKPTGVHVWEYQNEITGKWYEVRDRAICWVDNRMVRLEISTDITARHLAEIEIKRANIELETFCTILREIGSQQTLDGVSRFLMQELQSILATNYMQLYVFNSDRSGFFVLSDKGVAVVKESELVQTISDIIENVNGLTIGPKKRFRPPLLPDYFPINGRQSIIPFRFQNYDNGAFVVACGSDCMCDEKQLKLVELILEKASGTIKRAVLHHEEIHSLESWVESVSEFCGIIGKDPKMQVIYKLVEDIAPTDATVLIQGETGTGKEMVARAIYQQSLRKERPFIVINCSAYPSTLLESELFGHEKGAFTGAIRQKIGRFEQAHGGTVFLDEIGDISLSAQIKLLRVLQTQNFERLGGEKTVSVNVRILAATNKDLLQEVKNGNFREDLYYRLNVIPVHLPPLRLRRNDIPLLTRYFQQKYAKEHGGSIKDFTSEAMRRLLDYSWPGNVRELENSIEHAVVLCKDKDGPIDVPFLPSVLLNDSTCPPTPSPSRSQTILDIEKQHLKDVLEECSWNKSKTALRLGISRSTLYDKLKRYQLAKPAAQ